MIAIFLVWMPIAAAQSFQQVLITNFENSLTTSFQCLPITFNNTISQTEGNFATILSSAYGQYTLNLTSSNGKCIDTSSFSRIQITVRNMSLSSFQVMLNSNIKIPVGQSDFAFDLSSGYKSAQLKLDAFKPSPLCLIQLREMIPSKTRLDLVSVALLKDSFNQTLKTIFNQNAKCLPQNFTKLNSYSWNNQSLRLDTTSSSLWSLNYNKWCMDASRFDNITLTITGKPVGFNLTIGSSTNGACNNPNKKSSFAVSAASFTPIGNNAFTTSIPLKLFKGNLAKISFVSLSGFKDSSFNLSSINLVQENRYKGNFVWRRGSSLIYRNKPLRFASFNVPDLFRASGEYPNELDPREQEDLIKTIATYANGSSAVARPYVLGAIGWRGTIVAADTWDETNFRRVDNAIALANKYQVKLIIPLIDEWSWFGGIKEFCSLYLSTCDSFGNAFFTNEAVITGFQRYISYFLNRVNTVNGLKYKDDPAILAWELGNELGVKGSDGRPQTLPPLAWTSRIANYIKSIDSNHLVSDGGFVQPGLTWSTDNLLIPSVDLYSEHMYSATSNTDFGSRCIASRNIVRRYGKAYFVGEYGIVSDQTTLTNLLSTCFQDIVNGSGEYGVSALAGTLIWSLRGRTVQSKLGFYTHNENNDNRFWAYHYPGFPGNVSLGIASDEIPTMKSIISTALKLQATELGKSFSSFAQTKIDPPQVLSAQVTTSTFNPQIRFFGSVGATGYSLYSSLDNVVFSPVALNISEWTQKLFVDTNVKLSCSCPATIYYQLVAFNAVGKSNPINFTVKSVLGSTSGTCYYKSKALC